MFENKLTLATFDDWWQHELRLREWIEKNRPQDILAHDLRTSLFLEKRKEIHNKFSHIATVFGGYGQHDMATRWLFENIGSENGECGEKHSEFPGCPLVRATQQKKTGWSEYSDPGAHGHEGVWEKIFLGKTAYDAGPMEYCFQKEEDKERFLAFVLSSKSFGEYFSKELENDYC